MAFKNYKEFIENYFTDLVLINNIAKQPDLLDYWQPQTDENGDYIEPMQWFAVELRHLDDAEKLEKAGIIFYYEPLDVYVLPVTHYGTSWEYVPAPDNV